MMKLIANASPRNIGKVVKIKATPRRKDDKEVLLHDKLVTYTGILQSFGYNHETNEFAFRLQGDHAMTVLSEGFYYIEIHVYNTPADEI